MSLQPPLLSLRHLTLFFKNSDHPVVRDVNLDIFSGQTLALVGESGSGKTMIACSIARLLEDKITTKGEILFQGNNILCYDQYTLEKFRRHDIAYIFQEPSTALNPSLTVGYQLQEIVEEDPKYRIPQILKQVGFQDISRIEHSYPHELSGGMQQRVMIALALINRPKLLIADEPTTALDVVLQKKILDLIRELQKKFNFAVLLITHDFALLPQLAQDVCVLQHGVIVEKGNPYDILRHPRHPYTHQLVQSIFTIKTA